MTDSQYVDEALWASWTQVPLALSSVIDAMGDVAAAREEIWLRLKTGRLNAVAESTDWHSGHLVDSRKYERLFPQLWQCQDTPRYDSRFWKIGTIDFLAYDSTSRQKEVTTAYGVRFDPVSIRSMLIDAGVEAAGTEEISTINVPRKQDLPLLPDEIARAWMQWFKTQPNSSKVAAEAAARQMFPNHNLSRERIRELYGDSPQGRPIKPIG